MCDARGSESGSLLLVEDDKELASLMVRFLSRHGFQVDVASDGREGLARALSNQNDLVILDVMLPYLAGMEILRCVCGVEAESQSSSSRPVALPKTAWRD